MESGATIDGRKPIPGEKTTEVGRKGGEKESAPKASQVAGEGAKDPGTGKHIPNPKSTTPLNDPKAEAERISTGTTAEEQRKRLAAKMYPSAKGPREFGEGGTV